MTYQPPPRPLLLLCSVVFRHIKVMHGGNIHQGLSVSTTIKVITSWICSTLCVTVNFEQQNDLPVETT